MKVLVLLALVAIAAAWPNLGFQADGAGASDAQKQHDVNFLLHKIYGEIRDSNLKAKADSFDPEADLSHYSDDGAAVEKFMKTLHFSNRSTGSLSSTQDNVRKHSCFSTAPHTTYKYGGQFPSRPDNVDFEDVDGVARIRDLLIVESRIRDAIAHGYIVDRAGNHIDIMNERGIDVLGDIIESSMYSPNVQYYAFAYCPYCTRTTADPMGKYALPPGVLEHFETATRDPSFFRLHKYMDNIFKEHKDSLPPYTKEQLTFNGVSIENLSVDGELETFFEDFEYSLINAVDDTKEIQDVEISTYVPRLNHKDFAYNIEITNNNDKEVLTTVRIFAWPHRDNNGIEYTFDEGLSPGSNHIVRKSSESAVTVPDVPSFDTLFKKTEAALGGADSGLTEFESATGIPNRFLLPKGNEQCLEFDLVVAVTDGEADAAIDGLHENTEFNHYGAHGKYPDNRPHGYPLDRKVPDNRVFEDLPNFKHIQVKVFNHGEHIHHH
ncbi:hemocyanin subunit L3 [Penaeus vannamei]|uniref:Hemocyanin subunit L3 n=1 Tax=Penaeus vannamei TaxID=6689 RepID=A0A423SGQ0_PENVA|nr:hemocyanin subunit L3 [Penaeus vannamei]